MDGKNLLTSLATVHSNQQYRSERIGNALKSAQNLATDKADPRLRAACMEMESLFLTHLLKEMRATVDKSGFISGGRGEEIFTSLLDVELSKKMSAAGGIGLSSLLLEQLGGKAVKTDSPDSQ
jgi:flagellar protein FlgJ